MFSLYVQYYDYNTYGCYYILKNYDIIREYNNQYKSKFTDEYTDWIARWFYQKPEYYHSDNVTFKILGDWHETYSGPFYYVKY